MSSCLLITTQFWVLMDRVVLHLVIYQNTFLVSSKKNPLYVRNSNRIAFWSFLPLKLGKLASQRVVIRRKVWGSYEARHCRLVWFFVPTVAFTFHHRLLFPPLLLRVAYVHVYLAVNEFTAVLNNPTPCISALRCRSSWSKDDTLCLRIFPTSLSTRVFNFILFDLVFIHVPASTRFLSGVFYLNNYSLIGPQFCTSFLPQTPPLIGTGQLKWRTKQSVTVASTNMCTTYTFANLPVGKKC